MLTPAKVTQVSPLMVLIEGASTPAPASVINGYVPTVGDVIAVESYRGGLVVVISPVADSGLPEHDADHDDRFSQLGHAHDYAPTAHGHDYLPVGGKAADAELLDGIDSSGFLKKTTGTITADQGSENTRVLGTTSVATNTLNQNLRSGWYDGANMIGAPTGHWWLVQVISHGGGSHWQRQIAYSMTGEQATQTAYSRRCNGGDPTVAANWSTWEPFAGGDNDWITPTLTSAATNYGNGYNPAGYRKDASGFVHLRGLINISGSGAHAFTLPVGYRPAYQMLMGTVAATAGTSGSIPRCDVRADGFVLCYASAGWFALDNLHFMAEA